MGAAAALSLPLPSPAEAPTSLTRAWGARFRGKNGGASNVKSHRHMTHKRYPGSSRTFFDLRGFMKAAVGCVASLVNAFFDCNNGEGRTHGRG